MEKTLYTPRQTKALALYLQQCTAAEISTNVGVSERSVHEWVKKFGWREFREDAPIELVSRQRAVYLLWMEGKSQQQLNELNMLLKHHFGDPRKKGGSAKDGSNRGRPNNKLKNDITHLTVEKLELFEKKTFGDYQYQMEVLDEGRNELLNAARFYLKSRQIGLTFTFAWEAFRNAVETGDNQIFLSASKAQSEIFKTYIRKFALQVDEEKPLELKGKDEIHLSNGAILYFLSTNSRTGQGRSGHLYVDEAFWIPKFKEVDDLIGGVTLHDKWRTTYLSTASSIDHEAYPKWAGDKKDNIDISHKTLKDGAVGIDGIFRKMITIDDALKKGADKFMTMEKLKRKYPDSEVFSNLLRCAFIDAATAVFSIKQLLACKVEDVAQKWKDVDMTIPRPVGDRPVYLSYDPSGSNENADDAAIVIALPPITPTGAFRLVEKIQLSSERYETQAATIKELCEKYNVEEMIMDTSGIGGPVFELVEKFYPRVIPFLYSVNSKTRLVLKARSIISAGRLLFDGAWDDVVQSFMMVKRGKTTQSGETTYIAKRNSKQSHADLAQAVMMLFMIEGIDYADPVEPTVVWS